MKISHKYLHDREKDREGESTLSWTFGGNHKRPENSRVR